jgi:hypothetical protein
VKYTIMATSNETWVGVRMPGTDDLLTLREVVDGRQHSDLTEEEKGERVFASYGRRLLRSMIPDRHPCEEPTLADWECLEAERPQLYEKLSQTAVKAMAEHGMTPPSFATADASELATVHDIEMARAKRQGDETQQAFAALEATGQA